MDEKLINFILSFVEEMNQLENKYALLLNDTDDITTIVHDFLTLKQAKASPYLTERKNRVISSGISTPPQFHEISISNRIEVQHSTPTRTDVFFYTDNEGVLDYQFILLLKKGERKINSYKTKPHISGRVWQNRNI